MDRIITCCLRTPRTGLSAASTRYTSCTARCPRRTTARRRPPHRQPLDGRAWRGSQWRRWPPTACPRRWPRAGSRSHSSQPRPLWLRRASPLPVNLLRLLLQFPRAGRRRSVRASVRRGAATLAVGATRRCKPSCGAPSAVNVRGSGGVPLRLGRPERRGCSTGRRWL